MRGDADRAQRRMRCRLRPGGGDTGQRHAELAVVAAGRDLGVGLGVDTGVDADGDLDGAALVGGDGGEHLDLGFGFDVELQDAGVDAGGHLAGLLADPRKHDALPRHARRQRPRQLAARHDIGPRPQPRQRRQHRQIGIGLDREGDQRRTAAQPRHRIGEDPVMAFERRCGIAVEWRADGLGQRFQADILGMKHAALQVEMVHG